MTRWYLIFILLAAIAASACNAPVKSTPLDPNSKPTQPGKVLNVNDVWRNLSTYKGNIIVTGLVVSPDTQNPWRFTIMDVNEALACKETGCAGFYLTVEYHGDLPKALDKIKASGSLVNGVLIAEGIEITGRLNLDGK
jgi:hypothetical protein